MEDSQQTVDSIMQKHSSSQHPLLDEWSLWAHLPHDTDWSLNSYKTIYNYTDLENTISVTEALPGKLVKNCMLFVMRKGITPLWEDPKNRSGGCFSYKVNNKIIDECWAKLTFSLLGESLSNNTKLQQHINGITISPKKNFCIIKIWLKTCEYQDASQINDIIGIQPQGCLFKKHAPEY